MDTKTRIRFIVLRLKHLTLPEASYRLTQAVWEFCIRFSWCKPKAPLMDAGLPDTLRFPTICGKVPADEVARLLAGKRYTLNHDSEKILQFEDNESMRGCDDNVDVRAVWETGRLQHVYKLLKGTCEKDGPATASLAEDMVREDILKWIENNPFHQGVHYLSAMECGLRIPVFIYALQKLQQISQEERQKVVGAIYEHAWLIIRKLSLYSSLGNHTICEAVGLIYAGALFGETGEGKKWLQKGIALLTEEMNHQILDDGGPAEQSFHYHRFVLDLYWLALDILEKNQLYDCSKMKPRLMKGEAFLKTLEYASGKLPLTGDSDDGCAIAPGLHPLRGLPDGPADDTCHFPDTGYTVIKDACGSSLIFDHGPLGMPPLYNHGHADALSVTVSCKGLEMLVDPGTYRYNGVPEYRRYFKGTMAHNTVSIDAQDQAVQETGFIWSHPYLTEVLRKEQGADYFLIEALHTGYVRLKSPVIHRRAVMRQSGCIVIRDSFEGFGLHEYSLHYHLHPDSVAEHDGEWWQIKRDDCIIYMRLMDDASFRYVCGQEKPLLGWYSAAYGLKCKCGVLVSQKSGPAADTAFITVIGLNGMPDPKLFNFMRGKML